ncbi:hypothetical protein GLOIN_2v1835445 [Rhizophagus clarus]|uniref:Uncharacterized protein n=1 Tax=Rhizophagus clarus TaxID=94130 RepID=A0A8H3L587_9GLOM|nr:hypothetical protein GLOIN_2v1835445 [Rhizophagus clarus]
MLEIINKEEDVAEINLEESYLRKLPTYKILFERNTNRISSSICPRCDKEEENWEHMWTCSDNEQEIREIVEEAVEIEIKKKKSEKKTDELQIIQDILCPFVDILYDNSNILVKKTREWELLRGIFNNRFDLITKKIEERLIIRQLWETIYDHIKNKIWIKRCNRVNEIEKEKGITKLDKRKKPMDAISNTNKLIGRIILEGSIDKNWYTTMKLTT